MTRHAPKSNTDRPPASTRIPVAEAARQLGVTREHLSRVIHGHRISIRLSTAFAKLQAGKGPTQ